MPLEPLARALLQVVVGVVLVVVVVAEEEEEEGVKITVAVFAASASIISSSGVRVSQHMQPVSHRRCHRRPGYRPL